MGCCCGRIAKRCDPTGIVYLPVPEHIAKVLYDEGLNLVSDAELGPKPQSCDARLEPADYHITLATGVSRKQLESLRGIKHSPVRVVLSELSTFDSEDREVLKLSIVDSSGGVESLHTCVIAACEGLPPSKFSFNPHITICFAKGGLHISDRLGDCSKMVVGQTWEVDSFMFHVGACLCSLGGEISERVVLVQCNKT